MKPTPIRYVRTRDGTNIAYTIGGAGRPIVLLPFHWSNIERKWTAAAWAPGLAAHNQVVAYDSRGQGCSSRDLDRDPTVDDYLQDLEAVFVAAGLERASLVAYGGFAHVAIRFAVEHPGCVDSLILLCTCESFSAWPVVSMLALACENWELFLDFVVAKAPVDFKDYLRDFIRSNTTQADFIRLIRAFSRSNVSHCLSQITCPTLVLHSLNQHWLSAEEGMRFVAMVNGARLVFLDGDVEPDDFEGVRVVQSFLDDLPGGHQADAALFHPAVQPADLSRRQEEVLGLLALGRTTREIATDLVLSERTVERHISDVYTKIGANNRAAAIAYALRDLTPR